jgi:hypothetical protein
VSLQAVRKGIWHSSDRYIYARLFPASVDCIYSSKLKPLAHLFIFSRETQTKLVTTRPPNIAMRFFSLLGLASFALAAPAVKDVQVRAAGELQVIQARQQTVLGTIVSALGELQSVTTANLQAIRKFSCQASLISRLNRD